MSDRKPTPLLPQRVQKVCPVCGERSYSAAGVHPQCSVVQADAPRKQLLEAERLDEPKVAKTRSCDKKCPKCNAIVHVRRKECECGFDFFGRNK